MIIKGKNELEIFVKVFGGFVIGMLLLGVIAFFGVQFGGWGVIVGIIIVIILSIGFSVLMDNFNKNDE